jgi:hypothetical protein
MIGGGDEAVRGPEDAACRVTAAGVDGDDARTGPVNRIGQLIRDAGEQ